jgi:hypothetical protein
MSMCPKNAERDPTNDPCADVSRDVEHRAGVHTLWEVQTLTGQERKDAFLPDEHRRIQHQAEPPKPEPGPEIEPGREPEREADENEPRHSPEIEPVHSPEITEPGVSPEVTEPHSPTIPQLAPRD